MTKTLAILALAAGLTSAMTSAFAQETSRVHFAAGNDNAAINGTITGRDYVDYLLGARAGQRMAVALSVTGTNGSGSAYFNILPPGSDGAAIFNSSMSVNNFGEVQLPVTGDYTVRVYLMGNDYDAGKTVGYTLSVTIR
jgi:hypothetical protein